MKHQNFTSTISVDQTPQEAFAAINNVRGWWSGKIEGDTDKPGAYGSKRSTPRSGQRTSAEFSARIIKDPPFRFQRRPGPLPGRSRLKLQCFAQEPASSLESYLMSGAAPPILAQEEEPQMYR